MHLGHQPLQLDVFPMLGYRHAKRGCWRLMVQGRVSRPAKPSMGTRILLKGLKRVLRSTGETGESELFQRRIQGFTAVAEKGKRLYLEIGGLGFRLKRGTKSSGLFSGRLDLPDGVIRLDNTLRSGNGFATIPLKMRVIGEELAEASGEAYLASPTGLSVISDIDDTIKLTLVTKRIEMLAQTFSRPFQTIEGMAEMYRHWQMQGAMFHYVSSSPWQIYHQLHEFLESNAFPNGSMHLRWFRLRDEMFSRWRLLRRKGKGSLIANMVKRLPTRRFVLVGDSGERDPEIYAKIAQQFSKSIAGILIRDLAERPMDAERLANVHRKVGRVPVILFEKSHQVFDVFTPGGLLH